VKAAGFRSAGPRSLAAVRNAAGRSRPGIGRAPEGRQRCYDWLSMPDSEAELPSKEAVADKTTVQSKLTRFLSHPIAGASGWAATILALLLSIYFYFVPQRHRELSFEVHPSKTVIVKAGQLSRLTTSLDGKAVTTDLTATQVAFWNEGNEPIKSEHILSPLMVHVEAPILDVVVIKQSRTIVHLDIDKTQAAKGDLSIRWNILEQGDGAALQLIFGGGVATAVTASATIEEQPTIKIVEPSIPSDYHYSGQRTPISRHVRKLWWWPFAGAALSVLFQGIKILGKRQKRIKWPISLFVGITFLLVFMVWLARDAAPPFGF